MSWSKAPHGRAGAAGRAVDPASSPSLSSFLLEEETPKDEASPPEAGKPAPVCYMEASPMQQRPRTFPENVPMDVDK